MAMMSLNKEAPERQDIEVLLPWHAAGTLSRRDSDRVERALAGDRELARRYDLVREELSETIHLNETLGAPSARAMEKLFAAIDAEAPVVKRRSFNLTARIVEFVSSLSPRAVAYAVSAAVIALVVQTVVLSTVMVRDHRGTSHELASFDNGARNAVVRFAPQATLADVTRFLDIHRAVVIEGPKKGGLYKISLTGAPMADEEFARIIQRMRAESRIVEFIATAN
jgi:hypothetical protein